MCTVKETRFTIRGRYLADYLTIFRVKKAKRKVILLWVLKLSEHSHSTKYSVQVRLDYVDKSGMDYANIIH